MVFDRIKENALGLGGVEIVVHGLLKAVLHGFELAAVFVG